MNDVRSGVEERNAIIFNYGVNVILIGLLFFGCIQHSLAYGFLICATLLFVATLSLGSYLTNKFRKETRYILTLNIPICLFFITSIMEVNIYITAIIVVGALTIVLYNDIKLLLVYRISCVISILVSFILNYEVFSRNGDDLYELSALVIASIIPMTIIGIINKRTRKSNLAITEYANTIQSKLDEIEEKERLNKEFIGEVVDKNTYIKDCNDSIAEYIHIFANSLNDNTEKVIGIEKNCSILNDGVIELKLGEDENKELLTNLIANIEEYKLTFNELANNMGNIVGNSSEVEKLYEDNLAKFKDITGVVGAIEYIAYKTKLLSVNARIEANRIGNNNGFTVIADEVGSLADSSSKLAVDIGNQIKDINESLKITLEAMHNNSNIAEKGIENLREYSEKQKEMTESIGILDEKSSGRLANFVEFENKFISIMGSIKDMSNIYEEQNANVQEIHAMCEEQTQLINKTYELCNK